MVHLYYLRVIHASHLGAAMAHYNARSRETAASRLTALFGAIEARCAAGRLPSIV